MPTTKRIAKAAAGAGLRAVAKAGYPKAAIAGGRALAGRVQKARAKARERRAAS
jgi:hypothetical protein